MQVAAQDLYHKMLATPQRILHRTLAHKVLTVNRYYEKALGSSKFEDYWVKQKYTAGLLRTLICQ